MRHDRLPDGFGVRIDPRVRTYSGGRYLVGGSPTRLLRLAPEAAAMIGDGYLEVTGPSSARVARRLLDSGVANPRPRLLPSVDDVTVIVPVHNDEAGLRRLLSALRGHTVIVVDDGSDRPVRVPQARRCRVTVLRRDRRLGPAAARNFGLRAAATEFVAFLDPDVVPRTGWLEVMLGHFSDPKVALVAPRILAMDPDSTVLARYEHTRGALHRGRRESAVQAHGPVPYVPSAALLVRRTALLADGGFDESMGTGDDVDLCWRLDRAGWRLRYEPAARVAHSNPVSLRKWFAHKVAHGTGVAPLGQRHAAMAAPLSLPVWTAVTALLFGTLTRWGVFGGVLTLVTTLFRLRRVFAELDNPTRVAAIYMARGFSGGVWRLACVLCRDYWPVTLLGMLFSRRVRQIALTMAVADGLADWFIHRESGSLDPARYVLCKRLEDMAYGTGLWWGAARVRSGAALRPTLPPH
ncbi:mycofactocin biosynthesis glycosyltransferase MftF [Nocardia huaxiensis]|uniref:mycofactocin biosynthesis glycosyltransferase MftF n=1 Tax=Nocardia huaxiensis TaxID=2755382 RepID=UPI001E61D0C4|nr:mycofactocin biosynthesis glycosyltransferase MftF [Nocardia huaxiensis]UFS93901.1 mycofactocin biosynthesis glycosyltransferase MftF [Nocardia huaxiensis]